MRATNKEPMFDKWHTDIFAWWLNQQNDDVKARIFHYARDHFKYDWFCGIVFEKSLAREVERWERETNPGLKSWHGFAILHNLRDPATVDPIWNDLVKEHVHRSCAAAKRSKTQWLSLLHSDDNHMIRADHAAAILGQSRRQFFKLRAQRRTEESTLKHRRVNRRVVLYDVNDVLRVAIRRLLSQT